MDLELGYDKIRFEGIFDLAASTDRLLARLSLDAQSHVVTAQRLDGSEISMQVGTKTTLSIWDADHSAVLHQIHLLERDYTQGGNVSSDVALRTLLEQGMFEFA